MDAAIEEEATERLQAEKEKWDRMAKQVREVASTLLTFIFPQHVLINNRVVHLHVSMNIKFIDVIITLFIMGFIYSVLGLF